MSASDWEEIKKLATDFQRIQLSSSAQKLSERNCIEIVRRLIDLKLLEIIYTTDGKEYLTPLELSKEIVEELTLAGGRINLVDIQQKLNVDLSHIESMVADLLKSNKKYKLILGQLFESSYFTHLAEEINDNLQEQGIITLAELAKVHDLPGDTLKKVINDHLDRVIEGTFSETGDQIYTERFINRQKSIVRGIFSAIDRPTSVFPIISKKGFQEKLFYSLLEELISNKELGGSLTGGRPFNVTYTPLIYSKSQGEWVSSFFSQNSYLEYDNLSRLDISDPEGYIKKKFKNEPMEFLESCCLGQVFKERVLPEMEVSLNSGTFFDVLPHMPSICSEEDAKIFLTSLLKQKLQLTLVQNHFVINQKFLQETLSSFDSLIAQKAENAIKKNPSILTEALKSHSVANRNTKSEEDERRDSRKKKTISSKGGGSSGAGSQGREVKTKATKKKYLSHKTHEDQEDEEENEEDGNHDKNDDHQVKPGSNVFMTTNEISTHLSKLTSFKEAPQPFILNISSRLTKLLNAKYNEELKNIFLQTIQHQHHESEETENSLKEPGKQMNKKKFVSELSEKVWTFWNHLKLFEKGILHFQEDIQHQLTSFLLKSLASEASNIIFLIHAIDNKMHYNDYKLLTSEDRVKIISMVTEEKSKVNLTNLHKSLNGKSLDSFGEAFEECCSLNRISLKKDKKKERQLIFNHKQSLTEELKNCQDPALTLHICCNLLFQITTQNMIHTSGKFVPSIINFIQSHIPPQIHQILVQFQDTVVKNIKLNNSSNKQEKEEVERLLGDLMPKIKEIPILVKSSFQHDNE